MSDLFTPLSSSDRSSVFSIPAGVNFAEELAKGVLRSAADPQDLARALVMVPSRRAARALRAAFLNVRDGQAILLPRMVPIGDIDDDDPDILVAPEFGVTLPPPVNDLRRNLILARLLEGFQLGGHKPSPAQAMQLAGSLSQLLDQPHNADATPASLRDLLPEQFSLHWQDILKLFSILIERWPDILRAEGVMDAADRRNRLTKARTAAWRDHAPDQLIVLAGSTGTFAATRDLIGCVAGLPRGHVVLPGLDHGGVDHWHAVEKDTGHPQYQLSQLLDHLGLTLQDVALWNPDLVLAPETENRQMLMREVFKPAMLTTEWRDLPVKNPALGGDALKGMELIECPDKQSEALVIAVTMREVLETPNKTAALITPDRPLAEAVIANLKRWDLDVDDTAGQKLSSMPPGMFLQLLANAAAHDFAPVPLLALLKHPLMASGLDQGTCRHNVRQFERYALRGYRPSQNGLSASANAGPNASAGLSKLAEHLSGHRTDDGSGHRSGRRSGHRTHKLAGKPEILAFFRAHIMAPLADFVAVWNSPAPTISRLSLALAVAAERLAARQMIDGAGDDAVSHGSVMHDAGDGAQHLWRNPAGEAAMQLMRELDEHGHDSVIDPAEFPQILAQLLEAKTVRGQWQSHQRLSVLGPVEARMQGADRLIIAGFNEGHWPPQPDNDPWMNATMRQIVGLPARNWRSGLSAHDVYMAICGPEVIVTRSLRERDAATTPSRWLQRLTAVMKALEIDGSLSRGTERLAWASMLEPITAHQPIGRPEPTPPVAVRPREFSATEIDRWIEDPYAIYARRILGLRRLDDLDPPPDAALRGNLVHNALAKFIEAYPAGPLADDALDELLVIGRGIFAPQWHIPSIQYFWWPRFEAVAAWFIEEEQRRRETVVKTRVEIDGAISISGAAGDVVFKARADRLDFAADGSITIIDYKTGTPPTPAQVAKGRRTQLLIEALIAAEGGFSQSPAGDVEAMEYWKLTGKRGAVSSVVNVRPEEWEPNDTRAELTELVALFDDPETGYPSQPDRKYKPRFSDYEHLARVREWSAEGSDD